MNYRKCAGTSGNQNRKVQNDHKWQTGLTESGMSSSYHNEIFLSPQTHTSLHLSKYNESCIRNRKGKSSSRQLAGKRIQNVSTTYAFGLMTSLSINNLYSISRNNHRFLSLQNFIDKIGLSVIFCINQNNRILYLVYKFYGMNL